MPVYTYECSCCERRSDHYARTRDRDGLWTCTVCGLGLMFRQFVPTANIQVPEHFRHSQRDFLPPKGDAAWEKIQMGGESQMHERPTAGEQLAKELERA